MYLTLALLIIGLLFSGIGYTQTLEQVCFQIAGHATNQVADTSDNACYRLAQAMSKDDERLIQLARRLEDAGRYNVAIRIYRTAIKKYPKNKTLLKGLIRASATARGRNLLAHEIQPEKNQPDIPPSLGFQSLPKTKPKIDACWNLRWTKALEACNQELARDPTNASVHERVADILRSLGQPDKALASYKASLQLQPNNLNTQRKYNALQAIISDQKNNSSRKNFSIPSPLSVSNSKLLTNRANSIKNKQKKAIINSADTGQNTAIIQKLELLKDLKNKGLINTPEYQQQRQQILTQTFSSSKERQLPELAQRNPSNSAYRGEVRIIEPGEYYALVIGNNRYRDFPRLQTAINDAKSISSLLKKNYGFKVTTLTNASRYDVVNALSQLRRTLKESDNLLVYYAGHGVVDDTTGRGYWLPIDAEKDNFANWLSTNDVTDMLAGISSKHAIVIADSCFSGSLLRTGATDIDERTALLKRLASKRSRTVLTSGGLEPVLDDGGGEHSVFAKAFIDVLNENTEVVEAGRLFVDLRNRVILNADQTPQYGPINKAGHEGGDFIFVRK